MSSQPFLIQFLKTILKDGPLPRTEVLAVAKKEGIGQRSLYRAAEAAGIVRHNKGFGRNKSSLWSLPLASRVRVNFRLSELVDLFDKLLLEKPCLGSHLLGLAKQHGVSELDFYACLEHLGAIPYDHKRYTIWCHQNFSVDIRRLDNL